MDKPGKIYQAIISVMQEIGPIGKDQKNLQQKFNYRGIDDIYNHLQPIMAKVGLFSVPEILDSKREDRPTKSGGTAIYTILTVRFRFYASDGSTLPEEQRFVVQGEAMDYGDKATNKAMSAADKYACFLLFKIPTKELHDPDKESFELAGKITTTQKTQPKAPHVDATKPLKEDVEELIKLVADICMKMEAADNMPHLDNLQKKYIPQIKEYISFERYLPDIRKAYGDARDRIKADLQAKDKAPGMDAEESAKYLDGEENA